MRRTIQASSTDDLFDLPLLLDPPGTIVEEAPPAGAGKTPKEPPPEPIVRSERAARPAERETDEEVSADAEGSLLRRRLLAGYLDLGITAAALLPAVAGAAAMGVSPRLAHWPGYALFLLTLSFVYAVYSLGFWSRTPGMARTRLDARSRQGTPISLGQAIRRWLGDVVTVGLLGLPMLLLAWRRPSLADLLSDSRLES